MKEIINSKPVIKFYGEILMNIKTWKESYVVGISMGRSKADKRLIPLVFKSVSVAEKMANELDQFVGMKYGSLSKSKRFNTILKKYKPKAKKN